MTDRITEEVRALIPLNLEGLRLEWRRRRWGATPRLRSPELLRRMIAWRLQAATEGGLGAELKRALRATGASSRAPRLYLAKGTRLAREWQGVTHEVEVTERGFLYAGMTFRTLSAVAGVITGKKCGGIRFFGLNRMH